MSDPDAVVIRVLREMFRADTDAACGFYSDDDWLNAYARLQKIAKYKGDTVVFDAACDEFEQLPDAEDNKTIVGG